ncbi:S41 family peptidase [Piscinibacter gummiphilus]|uniref:Uncharacterized protein n=1 Tax=Piscinibacter gummiphilus TaxID=946333 RepID=A0A1W6LCU6_9BURK|nr:S41 family peptidase [Piscinibacter gummiphilus]ARN22101.1 hypothetical protein A4W93_20575 [Piscinibacter gummiphilus]ATU66790.1 peptidase S41 [Piscinibacter gummiphilus]GLS94186.1 peptidase S41 [Piscinibacter gummiphilus]
MRFLLRTAACAALALLASCGGDDDDYDYYEDGKSFACTINNEKLWLRGEMAKYYFWAGKSPTPSPEGYADPEAYLDALRFQGDASEPRDRFSYIESRSAFDEFFVEGRTLGYGVSVNGTEGTLPLKVRYVDPGSPAATAGVSRGDTVVAANGIAASQLVQSGNFASLSPTREGDVLTLVLETNGAQRTVTLTGARYNLVPVTANTVFTLPGGAKAGYLSLKDFVTQAEAPLTAAITQFRQAGATELILDLRYNGGGRVSTATHLGSLVTGATRAGALFTRLAYNPISGLRDANYTFTNQGSTAFPRVVVLTGPRTCSASEMVVNGLKPYATVVTIGSASCGKPVGFSPQDVCDNVYSLVNFESLNAAGQGKYYSGLPLTCAVKDDFSKNLGDATETLTAAALSYLQTGSCPVQPSSALVRPLRALDRVVVEPGQRSGMIAD